MNPLRKLYPLLAPRGHLVEVEKAMSPSQPLQTSIIDGRPIPQYEWDPRAAIVDGYKASVWVFSCISRIASAASSVPWRVMKLNGKDWEPEEGHQLEDLLEYPNEKMTRKHLIYYAVAWLQASGNALFRRVNLNDKGGTVAELWPMSPRGVEPVADRDDWVTGYQITEQSKRIILPANEVIHAMLPDPDNVLWGVSPLVAAWSTVRSDVRGSRWRADMFERGGVPPGAIVDSTVQTKEQFKVAKDRLREGWREAGSNAAPMLIGGGTKSWIPFGISAQDLQYLQGRQFSVYEIATAFNLLPAMFDPSAATYDNLQSALRWMYNGPVKQSLDVIEDSLNLALVPKEDRATTWIHYDFSTVEALKDDLAKRMQGVASAIAAGISPNDSYQLFDVQIETTPDGDTRLITSGLVPLKETSEGATSEAAAGDPPMPGQTPPQLADFAAAAEQRAAEEKPEPEAAEEPAATDEEREESIRSKGDPFDRLSSLLSRLR